MKQRIRIINLLALLLGVLATAASCQVARNAPQTSLEAHSCDLPNCPYSGKVRFEASKEAALYPDIMLLDLAHWEYPSKSYEQLDSLVNGCTIYSR